MKLQSVIVCHVIKQILVASRYKVWVCGCSLVGTAGSNTARVVDVYLF